MRSTAGQSNKGFDRLAPFYLKTHTTIGEQINRLLAPTMYAFGSPSDSFIVGPSASHDFSDSR